MKKKRVLIIVGCLLACLLVLREFGIVDANLYTSKISASQSSSIRATHHGEEKSFSYQLTVKYQGETLTNLQHNYNDLPSIDIEATLAEPVYSGNYLLPIVKHFKMTYQCEFATTNATSTHTVQGKIEGKVVANIDGFCSRLKAKELALEEAFRGIEEAVAVGFRAVGIATSDPLVYNEAIVVLRGSGTYRYGVYLEEIRS